MPALPAFATADGVVRGAAAELLVDPRDAVGAANAVVFTTPADVRDVDSGTGTVFSPAGVAIAVGTGRRHRAVASVAVTDLGGVVVEVVRLSPHSPDLVVVARAVDERGRPLRSTPGVVFAGDLVTGQGTESRTELSDQQAIVDTLDLLLGMLGLDDVVVGREGEVFTRGDVEDDRAARQQTIYQAPTLAEQAQRTLPLL